MTKEYRITRLESTLATLIVWLGKASGSPIGAGGAVELWNMLMKPEVKPKKARRKKGR